MKTSGDSPNNVFHEKIAEPGNMRHKFLSISNWACSHKSSPQLRSSCQTMKAVNCKPQMTVKWISSCNHRHQSFTVSDIFPGEVLVPDDVNCKLQLTVKWKCSCYCKQLSLFQKSSLVKFCYLIRFELWQFELQMNVKGTCSSHNP